MNEFTFGIAVGIIIMMAVGIMVTLASSIIRGR